MWYRFENSMSLKYKVWWKMKGSALLNVVIGAGLRRTGAVVEGNEFGENLQNVCGNCALIDTHQVL
jgi:hypothetical protein